MRRLIAGARPINRLKPVPQSGKTGSTRAMLELAYRLGVAEPPMILRISRELAVLVHSISNADGGE